MDAPPDLATLTARLAAAADDGARARLEWTLGERHSCRGRVRRRRGRGWDLAFDRKWMTLFHGAAFWATCPA